MRKFKISLIMLISILLMSLALTACFSTSNESSDSSSSNENSDSSSSSPVSETVEVWKTDPEVDTWLSREGDAYFQAAQSTNPLTIKVDESVRYQEIDGFGAAMTDSSAWLIWNKLSSDDQNELMSNLFDPSTGIGLNLVRIPMGATDVVAGGNYSYNDMPAGQSDPTLSNFSIAHDKPYLIPALQQARALNPSVQFMATPWSPPGWMKTSGSMIGGTLLDEHYTTLANYFVKYIQAYGNHDLPISYVTPQNEPMGAPEWPGMYMQAHQEIKLIEELGQAFEASNIATEIIAWDHNWDIPSYPESIFNDPNASDYAVGTGWHVYSASPVYQTLVHNDYPGKKSFLTEATGGNWQESDREALFDSLNTWIINGTRHWANGVILWNIALDENRGPLNNDTDGIPMMRGLVTINQKSGKLSYNVDYYALAHASKFVDPGAYRVYSNNLDEAGLANVAFQNPDGSTVLIVHNSGESSKTFAIAHGTESFDYSLEHGAAVTFKWTGPTQHGSTPAAENVSDSTHDFTFQAESDPVTITFDPALLPLHHAVIDGDNLINYSLPIGASIRSESNTPLDRSEWTVTASANSGMSDSLSSASDGAGNAIDGDLTTRWNSGGGLRNGDWFQVDLGSSQSFNQIQIDTGPSNSFDYIQEYQVYVSDDGADWSSALASGKGHIGPITITLPTTQTGRYIRIVSSITTDGFWWSIAEINVYAAIGTDSLSTPTAVSNGLAQQNWTSADGKEVDVVYNGTTSNQSFPIGSYTYTLPSETSAMFTKTNLSSFPTPEFSSMTPTEGISGSEVTISGANFGSSQKLGTVFFGPHNANIESWSDTSITLKAPRGLQSGTVPVSVFGASGGYAGGTSFSATSLGTSLARTGWTATASHTSPWGDVPSHMLDGNLSSRWSSGAGQSSGMWFQVDMGSPQTFNKIVLNSDGSDGDQLQKGDVEVSSDGANWTRVGAIADDGQLAQLASFPTQTARYIRVRSTSHAGNWWSVHEFDVYKD